MRRQKDKSFTNSKDFDGKTTTNVVKRLLFQRSSSRYEKAKTTDAKFGVSNDLTKLRANLTNISQIAFNTVMMQ